MTKLPNPGRRATEEWIGKTPDSKPPARVLARIFERHEGCDYLTGQKIRPGDAWECDHILALCNGGENRESNLAPAMAASHKEKTADDRKTKAKADRTMKKHTGITKTKGWWKPEGYSYDWGQRGYRRGDA